MFQNATGMRSFLLVVITFSCMPSSAMAIKAGYWPSYLNSTFPASSINFSYFTHVYYAFVQPDPTSFNLTITDFDESNLPSLVSTAHSNSAMAMLTIGGGSSNLTTFSRLARDRCSRGAFIRSSIEVARKFGLDGLDLDWEFPADEAEMNDLGVLFAEWRGAMEDEALASGLPRLMLSAAVYYASALSLGGATRSYPIEKMGNNLDFINAMCFDYHGGWNTSETGAPAALYDPNNNLSTSYGIQSWIDAGVPSKNLVLGIPVYGRSWKLKNASINGIGAPAVAVGPGENGVMIYKEILEFNKNSNATVLYDGKVVSSYSYAGVDWIGYDDTTSVAVKVKFAKEKQIEGYFFWALGYDDESWSISESAWNAWEAP